jgi:hypothetical protein
MTLSNEITDMIKVVLGSNLRAIEKLFLTIEWILRERGPYEFYEIRFMDMQRKIETLIESHLPSNLKRIAFKEAAEIFQINDENKLLSILIALSYVSYITNETEYDRNARKELLSKLSELGFSISEIRRLSDKWSKVSGSSEDLFNRVFTR